MTKFAFIGTLLLSFMILYFHEAKYAPQAKGNTVMTQAAHTTAPHIEIYTTHTCPYCVRAIKLLEEKKVAYSVIDVSGDDDLRAKMMIRANGRRTVPQIFINDAHIGGCDDLYALNSEGKLDPILGL
jgi:glutaredoxin 3